jgi:dolichol-phosphate mannosyltransferase
MRLLRRVAALTQETRYPRPSQTRTEMGEHAERPDLAVIIPALNERENLELLLPALRETLEGLDAGWEILVVDGGSTDGTAEVSRRRGARVVRQQERGYGGALLAGFAATTAPYIVHMDADLSHRPVFLEEFWKQRGQAEVFIASRYVAGGQADMGRFRRTLSRVLNTIYRRVLALNIQDLSSGYRMYRRDALSGLALSARDFDILEEILIRAYANGWQVREVPFHFMSRGSGRSHARLFKFGWAFTKTLLRMWQLRNSVASADYDDRAFDSRIPLQRYWQQARHRIILEFLRASAPAAGSRVLDVGCGSSRIIQDLPEAVGLDVLLPKLRFLRPRHGPLVQGSVFSLPFRDETFDTVICSEVIEHIPDVPEVLGEMTRVLRSVGTLIVGTPDYGRPLWWMLEWIYGKILPGAYAREHITHFTRAGLSRRLGAIGYTIQDVKYVGFCEMIFRARKPGASLTSADPTRSEAKAL